MMGRLDAWRARLRARPDGEQGQAILRIAIIVVVLAYTAWLASREPASAPVLWLINGGSLAFALALLLAVVVRPEASPVRRLIGAVHDNLLVTLWLFQAGPAGAACAFVFPFVTVGNGFRFGVRYLAFSGCLGAVGLTTLLLFARGWQEHLAMGTGILSSHVLVTIYIGALLRRLHRVQAQLHELATHDSLTGLPNRRVLLEQLNHCLEDAHTGNTACVYFDLNGFKSVNDAHGHDAGDRLLKRVAEQVSGCIRAADIVARLGGDEFAVVLNGVESVAEAEAAANRIIAAIEAIPEVVGHPIQVSASIGVAFAARSAGESVPSAETLVGAADMAMYRAKKAGTRRCAVVQCTGSPPASRLRRAHAASAR